MILEARNVEYAYKSQMGRKVLDNISIQFEEEKFYTIIGSSGAGKTTLLSLLAGLDSPTAGKIFYEGEDIKGNGLNYHRKHHISLVFQEYNLIDYLTAEENVRTGGTDKPEELLLKVHMPQETWKRNIMQLSGGQQQRVAIARALAMDPKILLCDEATSALDPTTTKSILALLKDINQRFGITIVIITHEMAVVQEVCTHVAIIDQGTLAETGTVEEVFSHPKTKAGKKLIYQSSNKDYSLMHGKKCIRIVFSENSSFEPVIGNMVLECKAPVNILLADTKDIGGIAHGQMILQLPEEEMIANRMIEYLRERKLGVEVLEDYV